MAKSEDDRRIWRTSKLPISPASTNSNIISKPRRAEMKHKGNPDYFPSVGDQDGQHFIHRLLTLRTPAARPRHPTTTSDDEVHPQPSGQHKRGADPLPSALQPPAKKPASRRIKVELVPADVASARPDKTDAATFSSLTVQKHYQPSGGMTEDASDMSESPPCEPRRQPPVWGIDPFQKKYEKKAESIGEPVTAVHAVPLHTGTNDRKHYGIHRSFKVFLGQGPSASHCKACGSQKHMTKDCHVPFGDGTVPICPFHNFSSRDMKEPDFHHLDGLVGFHKSWCPLVMSYESAIRAKDTERIRYMLPQMFGEFVLNRRRKPFCRVLNPEVCPIKIAIGFSREFCQGQMPSGLEKAWPYTESDLEKPEIREKLNHFDQLGWESMPPGELEAKSWDQIKQEYAQGIIPPQIHIFRRGLLARFQEAFLKLATAEIAGEEAGQRESDTQAVLHTTDESDDDKDSTEEEVRVEAATESDALLEKLQLLSAKVDSVIKRLDTSGGRQSAGGPRIKSESSAQGTRSDPIDID